MGARGSAAAVHEEAWRLWLEAVLRAAGRRVRTEWFGSPLHLWLLARAGARRFAAFPRDFRSPDPEVGRAILSGIYDLGGRVLTIGPSGDPWDRTSPSRKFAAELHKLGWLRALLSTGEAGARESLRLTVDWSRHFGRWNSFSWSGQVLERRVYNLACAMGHMAPLASDAEREILAGSLARQSRQLLKLKEPLGRELQRAVVVALSGSSLEGKEGEKLLARAIRRIEALIPAEVLPDGGHVSRSPEAGLELLFDLLSLDDLWAQRGMEAPPETARAIDRLTAALRFFTLPDGQLGRFQGGEELQPPYIAAARALDEPETSGPPMMQAPHSGYQRLSAKKLHVIVDAGAPAKGVWSASACAQTGAIEIVCAGERLVTNSGWSPRNSDAQAPRLTDGASTAALGHQSAGTLLSGWPGRVLGPRLVGGPSGVEVTRRASEAGIWLDVRHDGWVRGFGLSHQRRLFLDTEHDELRGEDLFTPVDPAPSRLAPYTVHFHVPPEVEAAVARDNKSVLLRGRSNVGWWLRNDAHEVRIEPSAHFREGRQLTSSQIVLMGHIHTAKGGRIRWKLALVEG
jgi:uncharacterized heparinase superfamily protein